MPETVKYKQITKFNLELFFEDPIIILVYIPYLYGLVKRSGCNSFAVKVKRNVLNEIFVICANLLGRVALLTHLLSMKTISFYMYMS